VHLGQRCLAVVCVDQDAVRQHFLTIADVLDRTHRRGIARREVVAADADGVTMQAQLQHLAGRMLLDQSTGRSFGDDATAVHHHEPVAQLLGFIHVVSRQHQGDAALLQAVEAVPQDVARLRIETGGRLVEQQQVGFAHQRAGDRESTFHPARQRVDPFVRSFGQLHELEQFAGAAPALRARYVEVAPIDHQVLDHGQLRVELVGLGDHTHASSDRGPVRHRIEIEDPHGAGGDRRDTADHPHGRGLAGTVGPQESERLTRLDVEIDAGNRGELAELLGQVAGADHR